MSLYVEELPGNGKPRLVFLHGFTQTRESWRHVAEMFRSDHDVAIMDLPGHGDTTSRPRNLDEAGQLAADASADSILIGYSMGARIALHAALQPSSKIAGLILIGAHPGIEDEEERKERRTNDAELAKRIEEIGTAAFLDEWLEQPMFHQVRHLDHTDRMRNSADGLAYALRSLGTGNQRVLDAELARIQIPVLVIAGDLDLKFTKLAERFRPRIKNVTIAAIPNASHACHLEQPEPTREVIASWLDGLGNGDPKRQ